MVVNGWSLYTYRLFEEQLNRLTERVEVAARADPAGYKSHPAAKLLASIHRHMMELIPADPGSPEFRQGNSLGKDNRHWFRAKFHDRYRLFFRFSTKHRIIVYAWVNDESSLRKAGAKSDPYRIFEAMLEAGNPPSDLDELLGHSRPME